MLDHSIISLHLNDIYCQEMRAKRVLLEPSAMVKSWGSFKSDALPVSDYAKYRKDALQLLDKVKFDL